MPKVNKLTRGGIYTALTILFVYLSSVSPTSKLSLLALASAIIPLAILTTDVKNAVLVYAASSILCFFLGFRGMAVIYTLFFGIYGIVKYYIESLRKLPLEYLLKFIFFNLSFITIYYFYRLVFTEIVKINFPIYILILGLEIVFFVYDYALTTIIAYINKRLIKI
jgi:hypothetical protein